MLLQCDQCAAPHNVPDGSPVVRCSFCGGSTHIVFGAAGMAGGPMPVGGPAQWGAQVPFGAPNPYGAPPPWTPGAQPMPGYVPPRANAARGVIVAALAIGMMGAGAAMFTLRGGSFTRALSYTAAPVLGTLTLAGAPTVERSYTTSVTGTVAASTVLTTCRGYMQSAPHLTLRLTAPQRVNIHTTSDLDLTMLVRDTSGVVRCDDDSGQGLNPMIDTVLAPGTYSVWVGSFTRNLSATFGLSASIGPIIPEGVVPTLRQWTVSDVTPLAPPTNGVVAVPQIAQDLTTNGVVTGAIPASVLGANCRGYITAAPQVQLAVAAPSHGTLRTTSTNDLTLVLRDEQGRVFCDDDSGGALQPRLTVDLTSGAWSVWVGTYQANFTSPFALHVDAALPTNGAARRRGRK